MDIVCSDFSKDQLAHCYQLDHQMMKTSWPIHHWLELADNKKAYQLQLLKDSKAESIIGFSLWKVDVIDHFSHLLKIAVRSDYQGEGLGKKLLDFDIDRFKQWGVFKFYLEVDASNYNAVGLYRSRGFKQVNIIKQFYSDGGDALILYKEV
jgi:ribosomal protein S18 acetylase RimI-like enzyme